jgi:phosphatidylinositol alpha-1,6-mannosyltransferase
VDGSHGPHDHIDKEGDEGFGVPFVKRINLLSYDYPPNDGGISRLCAALSSEFARRGRDMSVITVRAPASFGLVRPDVPTSEVPRKRWLRETATCLKVVLTRRSSCVLSSLWNTEGTIAYLARCTDAVVMAHGNEVMPYPNGLRYRLKGWLRRKVLSSARAVVCNSKYTERLVRAISQEANTVVITPGVDAARFSPLDDSSIAKRHFKLPGNRRIVLSVSRMDAYKGHDLVLAALARMPSDSRERLHYVAAGRGPHLESLKALATSLGLDACVTWLGFVADADLPALYGSADLFVLCTREDPAARGVEGFGMAFLEAQAAGVPVIGTRAGGIPDAVEHGDGGWLIEPGDVTALGTHLERLATGDPSFKEQGLRARKRALDKGSWQRYVNALLLIVDQQHD